MPITYGSHENVTASDIAFSIHTALDAAFYDVLYPEHEWYNVLSEDQIMRDINPGATQYAYISRDRQGARRSSATVRTTISRWSRSPRGR